MKYNIEIKNVINNCQAEKIIQIFEKGSENINILVNINNADMHWIYYLDEHCKVSILDIILDSKVFKCNDLKSKNNVSLVWQAYSDQKYDLVKRLLRHGASSVMDEGFSLLHWVSSNGDEKMLKIILRNDQSLNLDIKDMTNEDKDRAPLHWAAQENQLVTGSMLLEYGANINVKDFDGKTPLHIASSEGNKEFVELLMDAGADGRIRDNFNVSPCEYAELYGHEEIKKQLSV